MDVLSFIEQKRDGGIHSGDDIAAFTEGFSSGRIPDYQAAAWLMAVYFNGLSEGELREFTLALSQSGETLDFGDDMFLVDKHSTGGVGDKITLILVPLAAACGLSVAKLSGPGLGFTGGTADKLESIPGFRIHLSSEEFLRQVKKIGCAISGHSKDLAPAEGKFYALRDVSGTVPSLPLICSSIVSKKIAGGADAFVFDVKCGAGAFMKDIEGARKLAETLVSLSKSLGKKAMALVTPMDQPLGEWVGNAAEVLEAIHTLRGEGPEDVTEITIALVGAMISLAKDVPYSEGLALGKEKLAGLEGLSMMRTLIETQGGDGRVCDDPEGLLSIAPNKAFVRSEKPGVVAEVNAREIGEGVKRLGGGRMALGQSIDHGVAVRLLAKKGAHVKEGTPLLEIRYNCEKKLTESLPFFERAFSTDGMDREASFSEANGKRSYVLETFE